MGDNKSQVIKKQKQRKIGTVVSIQMNSTAVVSVDSFVNHPLYKKKIRKTKRFLVHDPDNAVSLGDSVTIEETRPISKLKRWIIVDVKKNEAVTEEDDLDEEIKEIIVKKEE